MSIPNPLICIVDDAADYRLLVKHLFNTFLPAYSVLFFTDGSHFLQELPQIDPLPNLVLLDLHMPILDGLQTLLRLKEQSAYKSIPVIMMSADASANEIVSCYKASASSFVMKAYNMDLMKEQLQVICQYWFDINQSPASLMAYYDQI